jgi:hypothetical protein
VCVGCGKVKALTHPGRTHPMGWQKDPGRKGVQRGRGVLVWLFGREDHVYRDREGDVMTAKEFGIF